MKLPRNLGQRAAAFGGLLVCLTGLGFTTWLAVDGLLTGVVSGKHSARYLRTEGDPFYYLSVASYMIGGAFWLALAAFAVLVIVRWKDWT